MAHDRVNFFSDRDGQYVSTLLKVGEENNIDYTIPTNKLNTKERNIALYGTGDIEYNVSWAFKRGSRLGTHSLNTTWKGFAGYLQEDYELKKDGKRGEVFNSITTNIICTKCKGSRYRQEINDVFFGGYNISQLSSLSITNALIYFRNVKLSATGDYNKYETTIFQIINKLVPFEKIGIGYLAINRNISSLSGGESQRLRIATQLASNLCGLTYVLDEPTIGLHSRDTAHLLNIIENIRENGNTVILVEHDPDVIMSADNVIDIGPGAGKNGGTIVAQGSPEEIISNRLSVTGRYLKKPIQHTKSENKFYHSAIKITGAEANNLRKIDVNIPHNCITSITGVSGSGKSSLVFDVITQSFNTGRAINCRDINFNKIDAVLHISQNSIGTSPLSTIATYTGLFDNIRNEFAKLNESKLLGYCKSHFSFNSKEGRCPTCKGMGKTKVSMDFLSDVWVTCDECHGKRFKEQILKVKLNDRSIIDILQMEVDEAIVFFENNSKLLTVLQTLHDIGLGYVELGQPTSSLSGGETQRLKLASDLVKPARSNTLFVFDEPSTGLHMKDVEKLISIFNKLILEGHTIIVVEHNLEIIGLSDWVIDLGPEGGDLGGELIYSGSVSGLMKCNNSFTSDALNSH